MATRHRNLLFEFPRWLELLSERFSLLFEAVESRAFTVAEASDVRPNKVAESQVGFTLDRDTLAAAL